MWTKFGYYLKIMKADTKLKIFKNTMKDGYWFQSIFFVKRIFLLEQIYVFAPLAMQIQR